MKFKTDSYTRPKLILYNDHYVAIPYDCSSLTSLAVDGVIPAGTIIPSNDENAKGVLLTEVTLADDPNGTIVIHGFIKQDVLPEVPSSAAVNTLKLLVFMDN